jgi:hypothetical protein
MLNMSPKPKLEELNDRSIVGILNDLSSVDKKISSGFGVRGCSYDRCQKVKVKDAVDKARSETFDGSSVDLWVRNCLEFN